MVDSSDEGAEGAEGADSDNEQLQPAPLPPPGFPVNGAPPQLGQQPGAQTPGAQPFTTTLPGNPLQTGNVTPPQQPAPVNPDAGRRPPADAERPLPGSMNTIPPVGVIPTAVPQAPAPPSAAQPSGVQPPLAGIPGLTSIAREEVAPTGSAIAAPQVSPANTGGDSDRGIAVGITFGTLALIGILVAIGIFVFKKKSAKKTDVEAAAPPPAPAPVAVPAPLAVPQTTRAPRANNQTIIEAYGGDENDMEQMGYYNEKGFQKLPPIPQQRTSQDYRGEDDYNNNNSYMPGQGGLPVAQRDSDGRYLGR
ncbi:hypothetical protein ACHAQH_009345 [Verticillium albo-atrum]